VSEPFVPIMREDLDGFEQDQRMRARIYDGFGLDAEQRAFIETDADGYAAARAEARRAEEELAAWYAEAWAAAVEGELERRARLRRWQHIDPRVRR
jgi:hypothetical protein